MTLCDMDNNVAIDSVWILAVDDLTAQTSSQIVERSVGVEVGEILRTRVLRILPWYEVYVGKVYWKLHTRGRLKPVYSLEERLRCACKSSKQCVTTRAITAPPSAAARNSHVAAKMHPATSSTSQVGVARAPRTSRSANRHPI